MKKKLIDEARKAWPEWLLIVTLFIGLMIVYRIQPTSFFRGDDSMFIGNARQAHLELGHLLSRWLPYFRPLPQITFYLIQPIFTTHYAGYSWLLIIWHGFNVVLAYLLLKRLLNSRLAAAVASLFFAFAVNGAEATLYVAALENVEVVTFILLSMLAFWEYQQNSDHRYAIAGFISYLLALTTMENAQLTPILITFVAILSFHNGKLRQTLLALAPYYVALIGYILFFGAKYPGSEMPPVLALLKAHSYIDAFQFYTRSFLTGLGLTGLPYDYIDNAGGLVGWVSAHFPHYINQIMSLLRVGEAGPERLRILAGLLTLIALILGVVISLFNRKHFAKVWIFAIWVPLTIAPYAITWPIMDHFDSRSLYLPLIGLGALFGYGVSVVVNSIVGWPWLRTMNASVHLMVVAFLAALAIVPVVVANSNYLLHLQDRLLQQGKSAHQAINALVEHMPKIIEKDLVYLDMPDVFSGRSMAVVQMYVPYSVIRQDKIVINNPVYLKVLMKERHVSADRVVYLHYDGRKFQDQSSQLGLELASSFDSGTIKAVINPVLSGQQYYYPSYDAGNLNLSTINSYTCQVTSSYEPRQPTQLPAVYSDIATETLLNDSAVIKTDPDYARRTLAGYPRNISDKKSFFYLEPIMLFLQAQDEIVLDLGEVTSFEQVVWLRDLSGAYHDRVPTKVSISVSSDLKGWQSVTSNVELKDVNKLAAGLITFPKQEGRYLKLEITDSIGHLPAAYEKILVPPMSYSTLPLDQNLVDNLINPLRSFRDRATVGTIQSLKMGLIKPTLTVKDIATGTTETQTVLLPADEAQISLSSNMVSVFKINPKSFGITKWIDRLTLDFVVPPGEVTVDRLSCQP